MATAQRCLAGVFTSAAGSTSTLLFASTSSIAHPGRTDPIMPVSRIHAQLVAFNSSLYFLGGLLSSALRTSLRLDLPANGNVTGGTWVDAPSFPAPGRYYFSSFLHGQ